MAESLSLELEILRAGEQMLYKVTVFDASGQETEGSGWIVARNLDRTEAAMAEAETTASQWSRQRGIVTYDLIDKRNYDPWPPR
ncbi:hypothetical protein CYK37_15030 [Mesorhizobium loti]|nr:hypothetical protein [Mesorhizobium loti]PLP58228.1 hypothetical protein CYK37_15030 [Mesorhizobium loti]